MLRKNLAARAVLACLLGCSLIVSGCSSKETAKTEEVVIKVSGAEAAYPLIKVLVREFEKSNKDVKVSLEPAVHTAGAIEGVKEGLIDIGFLTRDLDPEDKISKIESRPLSIDGIIFAVSKDVNLSQISSGQIKDIYGGVLTNWKDITGYDKPITVLDRLEDKSAKKAVREFVIGKDLKVTQRAIVLDYEDELIEAVKTTEGSIGYFSLGYAASFNGSFNVLKLDGVTPSVKSVKDGSYKPVRLFYVVTKKPAGKAKAFLEYIFSPKAQALMESSGYAEVK